MNMEIGTEAAQFPEKEYISGIFLAVRSKFNSLKVGSRRLCGIPVGWPIPDLTSLCTPSHPM
jgi:hypothetical protein